MREVQEEVLVKVGVQLMWLMAQEASYFAQEASYFAQETVVAEHMQLGQEERLKQQDVEGTKAVGGEELANQQEVLEQQNYTCSQNIKDIIS